MSAKEYVDYGEMTYGKRSGVVTIEYHFKTDNKTEVSTRSSIFMADLFFAESFDLVDDISYRIHA